MTDFIEQLEYVQPHLRNHHSYVLPIVWRLCADLQPGSRVLDIGCGNGAVVNEFIRRGHTAVGVDLSESGINLARASFPKGRFEIQAADNGLFERLEELPFDVVFTCEVIEHLYDTKSFMQGCYSATKPGGRLICSTPYHGYLKNLTLSVTNSWDRHADPMAGGGHIKFFSRKTLGKLMTETGYREIEFAGAGRLPYLWMSMVMTGIRPT